MRKGTERVIRELERRNRSFFIPLTYDHLKDAKFIYLVIGYSKVNGLNGLCGWLLFMPKTSTQLDVLKICGVSNGGYLSLLAEYESDSYMKLFNLAIEKIKVYKGLID